MPDKKQSIILGGLVVGLLGTSYLGFINYLCCLGIISGALIAVWHYTDTHEITIATGKGATLGIMAAIVGWGIAVVLTYGLMQMGIRHDQFFAEFIMNKFGDSMQPAQLEAMEEQMSAEITLGSYLLSSLVGLVFSVIFGAIGGAIGAKIFKKDGDEPTDFDAVVAVE